MMRKVFILFGIIVMLAGCRAHYPVAQQSGKENVAYLLFESGDVYKGKTVDVTVDGGSSFQAQVVKAKKANRRGTQYSVPVGVRTLTVKYHGHTIYEKQIFLSNQETKIIVLQ